jgi:DNA primase
VAGKIPDETLQAIRERVSIVEVVSGYVSLKKSGRNHLGLCPFHAEKTPSFTVSDERGLFHCFGCGAGGTVFTFVMRADKLDFREAVETLARRAGVVLPKRSEPGAGGEQRHELLRLNEFAQRCFREALQAPSGAVAREYLAKRGLSPVTIERYGLGFCPASGSGLARALAVKPVAVQKATELGLLGRRPNGTLYDRLWGRVTFPILDGSGRIVGFGGRTLGSEQPKYLNSPDSTLFHKGQVLYGLYEARQVVREAERIVIVEGYLDALALVEAGIGYAVASLGTAFTLEQLRLAARFAPKVVVFFDGDPAGKKAADRALSTFSICIETGVWGLGAFLPEGLDPDSFVRTQGAAATLALLQQAIPLWDFFLQRHDPGPDATVPERVRAAEEIKAVIDNVRERDVTQYNILVRQAAERLRIDETSFRQIRAPSRARTPRQADAVEQHEEVRREEEEMLIEVMALDRDVALLVLKRGTLESFKGARLADAGRALLLAWERSGSSAAVVDQLPTTIAQRVTAGLLGEGPLVHANRLQVAQDCIAKIEQRAHRSQDRALNLALKEAEASGDETVWRERLRRKKDLLDRRREIGHG